MDNFTIYLLQSSLCLTLFLLFYLLLLKKETYYAGNRLFLVLAACFSVIVPLFRFGMQAEGYSKEIVYFMAPVFVAGKIQTNNSWAYLQLIPEIIYFAVLIILLLNFLFKLLHLFLLAHKSKSVEIKGQSIILLENGSTPFSFLNKIFLSKEQMSDSSCESIIAHERMHVRQLHSLDIILFELIKIMQWFNPFAWKFKKELEAQHEFSADSGLISDGIDINAYKNILVACAIGVTGGTITNNFNSLLKRRLEMLSKKKYYLSGKVKLIFTLPIIAFLILFLNVINGSISLASVSGQNDQKEKVYKQCDEMPYFPGGEERFAKFMRNNIVYPESAKKSGTEGKVFVGFVIDKDGSVTNVEILKKAGSGFDEEAVRVINLMPKWNPGKDKGKLVKVKVAVPVVFALK